METRRQYVAFDLYWNFKFTFLVSVGESEVDNFNSFVFIDEDVLGLEVSVGDSTFVKILDSRNNLLEKMASLFFL